MNEYLDTLDSRVPTTVSVELFDTPTHGSGLALQTICSNQQPVHATRLSTANFVPRGMTPLYDAIGAVVAKIDDMELPRSAGVVLVILTDGLENQSREHTSASIRRLLDDRQDRQGWMVVYLGANQNAILEGAKFGTRVSNTMTYSVDNIGVAMAATSRSTMRLGLVPVSHTSMSPSRLRASGP